MLQDRFLKHIARKTRDWLMSGEPLLRVRLAKASPGSITIDKDQVLADYEAIEADFSGYEYIALTADDWEVVGLRSGLWTFRTRILTFEFDDSAAGGSPVTNSNCNYIFVSQHNTTPDGDAPIIYSARANPSRVSFGANGESADIRWYLPVDAMVEA